MTVYEAFSLKTKTLDGFSILVGGFCPQGTESFVVGCFSKAASWLVGGTADPEVLDRRLADYMSRISPSSIPVLGACIHVPGMKRVGGGIIGSPKENAESAMGCIEPLGPDLFLVSFPGGPGIAFKGSFNMGRVIWDMVAGTDTCPEFSALADELENLTDLFLAVADGSGNTAKGMILARDNRGLQTISL